MTGAVVVISFFILVGFILKSILDYRKDRRNENDLS